MKCSGAFDFLPIIILTIGFAHAALADDPLTQARRARVERFIERNHPPAQVADEWRKKMVPLITNPNWADQVRLRALYNQAKAENSARTVASTEPAAEKLARAKELATYEVNKDGVATMEERSAVQRARLLAHRAEYLKEQALDFRNRFGDSAFEKFDRDQDGTFSRLEFLDATHAMQHAARLRAQEILRRYDADQNGNLDVEEDTRMRADLNTGKWKPTEWVLISAFE